MHLTQSSDHYFGWRKLAKEPLLPYFDNNKDKYSKIAAHNNTNTNALIWVPVNNHHPLPTNKAFFLQS